VIDIILSLWTHSDRISHDTPSTIRKLALLGLWWQRLAPKISRQASLVEMEFRPKTSHIFVQVDTKRFVRTVMDTLLDLFHFVDSFVALSNAGGALGWNTLQNLYQRLQCIIESDNFPEQKTAAVTLIQNCFEFTYWQTNIATSLANGPRRGLGIFSLDKSDLRAVRRQRITAATYMHSQRECAPMPKCLAASFRGKWNTSARESVGIEWDASTHTKGLRCAYFDLFSSVLFVLGSVWGAWSAACQQPRL
jgi:hypothetical protein